jgi:uncharacterized membrane protein YbhN (UPF0104 family)
VSRLGEQAAGPRRLSGSQALKIVFGIAAVALLVCAVVTKWESFAEAVVRLSPWTVAVAFVAAFVANLCNGLSWWQAYGGLGMKLPGMDALRVFWVSQIGKYIPGSVWPVLTQMEMAKDRGYSRTRSFTASVVAMIVPVVTSGVIAAVLMVLQTPEAMRTYWYVLVAIPVGVIVLLPPVLRWVLQTLGRLTHRTMETDSLNGRGILLSVLWSVGTWVAYGFHSVVMLDSLTNAPVSPLLAAGAFAMSWVAGFLFIPAPAGVGVREAVLILALGGALLQDDAFAFAIVSRVLLIAVDAVSALIGVVLGMMRRPAVQRS